MAKRGKSREEKDFQAYKTEIKKRLNENSERGALMKGYRARHYWAVSLLDFGHVPLITGDREHSDSVCAAARGLIEWFRGEQDEVALWISDGNLRAMIRATPEAAHLFHTRGRMSEGRVWRLAEGEDQVAELMENLAGTVIGRLADVGREEDPDAGMLLHRLCMERHHWRIGRIARKKEENSMKYGANLRRLREGK